MNSHEAPVSRCWLCREKSAQAPVAPAVPPLCPSCHQCTRVYEAAWQRLQVHLRAHWRDITARGSFDLSKVSGGGSAGLALDVHLFFVKLLADRLSIEGIVVNLDTFANSLRDRTPHPEVVLLVADASTRTGALLLHDSEVSLLRSGDEVQSALCVHLVHPVAVKVCYLKSGAPIRAPDGFPWHPTRQRKLVKLSPYRGDAQPLVARRDLRI